MRSIIAALLALTFVASQSFGSFHLWKFDQAFSNADGSQQFLELSNANDGEQFFNTDAGGGLGPAMLLTETGTHTFTFPNDLGLPTTVGHDTAGQHVLIATTGFHPGGKIADFSIPAGFFSPTFDVVRYTPNDTTQTLDTIQWDPMPSDGINALFQDAGTTNQTTGPANPRNFTGQVEDTGGGGGGNAIPLPPAFYPGLAGLCLAAFAIHRTAARQGRAA